ncbi:dihydrolipoyl dehydrogenase [Agrilactobacillus fermenti]|uniref:dihydrolipoyl dehydrogenase n=1 Tax=Agrilactobacillus fermenti TaxID=2586909 RepID=UPI003A5C5BD4
MDTNYDVVVLGGGVGGYTAAIQAAKHHLKVALIEAQLLGGVCLNQGCIPTKTYLKSAEVLRTVQKSADFGIHNEQASFQFDEIHQRKEKVVTQLRQGVTYLMQKNKITVISGFGKLQDGQTIQVTTGKTTQTLHFKNLILATGAQPKTLPGIEIDGHKIVTSKELLEQTDLPKSMVIIGAGAIGLEWASLLNDLGVDVNVLEYADHILPTETAAAGRALLPILKRHGLKITTTAKVQSAKIVAEQVVVGYEDAQGKAQELTADQVLVAVGRQAQTEGMGLAEAGVQLTAKGTVQVDNHYQTSLPHVFAIGDCIDTLQLAHVAMAEGIHAIDFISGQSVEPIDYDQVPRCIYTYPELAVVGPTMIAQQKQDQVKTGTFPLQANGKALIEGEAEGQVQVTVDTTTDDLLQLMIIGPHATDMVMEGGLGLYLNASATEIGAAIHPHPTLSEAVRQATLMTKDLATDI